MKFYTTSKLSENIHETPEGFLVCTGVSIARTGDMIYGPGETPIDVGPDGKVFITRSSEEVFRPETIASFEGKAVTVSHPVEFVSPDNWTQLSKGVVQNVRRGTGEQESDLIADLLITVGNAIELIKNGLREVSCGYEAEYTQTGVGRGYQSKIIGNHLALVEEGRAGSSYAINDHKGKVSKMKLSDRVKAIFAKAQDEAMQVVDESANVKVSGKESGFVSYDDFKSAMDKIDAFMGKGAKDASTQPTENQPAHIEAKDEPEESEEEKKKKARDAWIDAMMSKESEESKDAEEEGEESEDAEEPGAEEGEGKNKEPKESEDEDMMDDDFEESTMVGDTASRIEILAPGMKAVGKNPKLKALLAAYQTKDGKAAIDLFTDGKAPQGKEDKEVHAVFVGASEILKESRSKEFSRTKTHDDSLRASLNKPGHKTAEEINEIHSKYWASRIAK